MANVKQRRRKEEFRFISNQLPSLEKWLDGRWVSREIGSVYMEILKQDETYQRLDGDKYIHFIKGGESIELVRYSRREYDNWKKLTNGKSS